MSNSEANMKTSIRGVTCTLNTGMGGGFGNSTNHAAQAHKASQTAHNLDAMHAGSMDSGSHLAVAKAHDHAAFAHQKAMTSYGSGPKAAAHQSTMREHFAAARKARLNARSTSAGKGPVY